MCFKLHRKLSDGVVLKINYELVFGYSNVSFIVTGIQIQDEKFP